MTESRVLELEIEWGTQETRREDSDRDTDTDEDTTWETNPLPLMTQTGRGSLVRLAGGKRKIWTRFTYGTLWTMRIDKTRWSPSVKKTIGWYGKRRIPNGHKNCNGRASTSYYPWTKTPERTVGAIKLRDGGGEETSKPQKAKKQGNTGWNPQQTYQVSQQRT